MSCNDQNYSPEILSQANITLDRTIRMIEHCNNKAVAVLSIAGVMISISLSDDTRSSIASVFQHDSLCFKVLFLISGLLFAIGIALLCYVIGANIKCSNSKLSLSYTAVKDKEDVLDRLKQNTYLIDLAEQISINAKIARNKFFCFNCSLLSLVFAFGMFTVTLFLIQ